jgi:hypothetical protein
MTRRASATVRNHDSFRHSSRNQVLIMSEESRLGREQIETAYALKQIIDAGVRVSFYLEDRERTLDSAMDKVMLSLTNFAAEMERELRGSGLMTRCCGRRVPCTSPVVSSTATPTSRSSQPSRV